MTRDLGVASCCCGCRGRVRRSSTSRTATRRRSRRRCRDLVVDGDAAGAAAKLRAAGAARAFVLAARRRLRHDHQRPGVRLTTPGSARAPRWPSCPTARGSRTPIAGTRPAARSAPCTVAYAGHLYAWKGVDVLLEALAHVPDVQGSIVGGHETEPDLARLQALAARLGVTSRVDVHRASRAVGVAGAARAGRHPGAAEPGVGDLEPRHVAAEAVRVHGGGQGRSSRRTCRRSARS